MMSHAETRAEIIDAFRAIEPAAAVEVAAHVEWAECTVREHLNDHLQVYRRPDPRYPNRDLYELDRPTTEVPADD